MPKGDKNSLDYRRKQSSESNQNRWKNGCPEETRKKLSESAKKMHERHRKENENGRRIC